MEWTNEKTLELTEFYRNKKRLWDPKCKHYKILNKKKDTWKEISAEMKLDTIEAKMINSVPVSFIRERQKESVAKTSGSGSDDVCRSTWFAFTSLIF
nr:unnamed protein product [Callosobruchus analis]